MTTSDFNSLRGEIHDVAERLRWRAHIRELIDFNRLFGASDSLYESSLAADAYETSFRGGPANGVLIAYGFLQALFVMQDATRQLSHAVLKRDADIFSNPKLSKIRSARNRICGHLARADKESADGLGISSAFFPFADLKNNSFRAHLYLEGRSEDVVVDIAEWREVNRRELVEFMVPVHHRLVALRTEFASVGSSALHQESKAK